MKEENIALINESIDSPFVLLIDEQGENRGRISNENALRIAEDSGLDLVKVSDADVPVCKILDYSKMRYEETKRKKQQKVSKTSVTKEIKFHLHTADHDVQIKHNKIRTMLGKHFRVKYSVELNGRDRQRLDEAIQLVADRAVEFEDIATWDKPTGYGRSAHIILRPK